MPEVMTPGAVLCSRDPELIGRIRALAAAAGCGLQCSDQVVRAPGALLLVGADAAAQVQAPLPSGTDQPAEPVVVAVAGGPEQVPAEVWRGAAHLGARRVVTLPEGETWLLDLVLDHASHRDPAPVVAVVGGRGGAGATVLAVSLAVSAAAARRRPVLIDLDRRGSGVDLVLGAEDVGGLTWHDLMASRGAMRAGALTGMLPSAGGVGYLTWPRHEPAQAPPAAAVGAVVRAAARESDLVVLDLPRQLDGPALQAVAMSNWTVLVVPAEVRAAAAAARVLSELEPVSAGIFLVVRGPAPAGVDAAAIADALGLPLAASVRAEPGLAAALERGLVPPVRRRGPLGVLSGRLLAEVGVR